MTGKVRGVDAVLVLVAAVLFGLSPIMAKTAYAFGATPVVFVALRSALSAALLWLGLIIAGRGRVPVPPRARLAPLLALGLTLLPMQVFGYFYALSRLPASTASVLINAYAIHVAWLEWAFLGARLSAAEGVILLGIVGGVVLVAGGMPQGGDAVGLAVLAGSTLLAAGYLVAQRRIVRDISPLGMMSVTQPASAAVYWAAAASTGQLHVTLPLPALLATGGSAISAGTASLLVLIALRTIPASRVAILGTLEPVVTVALSVLLLGDAMTPLRALGMAAVLGGIMLLNIRRTGGVPGGAARRREAEAMEPTASG